MENFTWFVLGLICAYLWKEFQTIGSWGFDVDKFEKLITKHWFISVMLIWSIVVGSLYCMYKYFIEG